MITDVFEQNKNNSFCEFHSDHEDAIFTCNCISEFLSKHRGIIRKIQRTPMQPDEPLFYNFESELCDPRRWYTISGNLTKLAFGTSICDTVALAKSIGEAIERFCLYCYCEQDILIDSFHNLEDIAIDPRQFALPSNEELDKSKNSRIKLNKFSINHKLGWVKGIDLITKKETYIPASYVFVGYKFINEKERITYPESTGASCNLSEFRSIIGGILEVIERDSFMINWLNKIPAPKVSDLYKTNNPLLREILKRLSSYPAKLDVYLLPTDLKAHVALATITHRSKRLPTLCSGLSANLNPINAITRAIEEAVLVLNRMRNFSTYMSIEETKQLSGGWYATIDTLEKLDFLLNSNEYININDLESYSTDNDIDNLYHLVNSLESKGLHPIVVNIGIKDFNDLGFSIFKVIIPGMQPLSRGTGENQYWFLTGERIQSVPKSLGYNVPKELNLQPHLWT